MNATLSDEGNSSMEGDQPLAGVLYVEQAASRLEIIYDLFQIFNLIDLVYLVKGLNVQQAYFETLSVKVKVDVPVRVCQLLQFPSGRRLQFLPERHYK